MIVEQIWTGNNWRNFNYLIACPQSGEAMAIDPLDYEKCLGLAKDHGWNITQVLNTHEHGDHTGGNTEVIAATGARLLAHAHAQDKIDCSCKPNQCPGGTDHRMQQLRLL